jgi:hypothetical protein
MKKSNLLFGVLSLVIVAIAAAFLPASTHAESIGLASMGLTTAGSPARQRAIYNNLQKRFNMVNGKSRGLVISEAFLQIEKVIDNNNSQYIFKINADAVKGRTEKGLDRNDLFVVTHHGFFLSPEDTTKEGKKILHTYPNPTAFAALNPANYDYTDLELIYNGTLQVKIGTTVFIDGLDMRRFRSVPETQQSAGTNRSQGDQFTGYVDTEPHIYLNGDGNNEIIVNIPGFAGAKPANDNVNTVNKLIWIPKGFIIKGGAGVKPSAV